MLARLRADCIILLDDGARPAEQDIAQRWADLIQGQPELQGADKPFIRLRGGSRLRTRWKV